MGRYIYLDNNGTTEWYYNDWNWHKDGTAPSGATKYKFSDQEVSKNATTKNKDVVTMYAQWSPYVHTVTYSANGGSGVPGHTQPARRVHLP